MNIKSMLRRNRADTSFIRHAMLKEDGLLFDRTFWRPILSISLKFTGSAIGISIAMILNSIAWRLIKGAL